ncbi:hypothetical protein GPECTOR_22g904 [Gonium pectorale]|uniref:Uncharacterized protein n=1 Tax=Gonium pectorale TaxID=33097 RepID=A0A150GIT1_GONPE|nr:hypothetical protein GPECTOR_22g904 [Gonium pectorale]|eukprot:KXZ49310.1 hypothetical protein GPECTOR_22g904 [Gonium pectorale]
MLLGTNGRAVHGQLCRPYHPAPPPEREADASGSGRRSASGVDGDGGGGAGSSSSGGGASGAGGSAAPFVADGRYGDAGGGPAGAAATGGGGNGETGRSCESADSAFRDVMLSRLAALESQVASLQAAARHPPATHADGSSDGDPNSDPGSGGGVDAGASDGSTNQGQEHDQHRARQRRELQHEMPAGEAEAGGAKGKETEGTDAAAGEGGSGVGDGIGSGNGNGNGRSATEAVAEGLSKLHPKITRLVQSGYLESLHHLRQRLMVDEWDGGGRQRALRRGVADFEQQCADKQCPLSWEELSQLYRDPTNLDVIRDPRVRMAARATIQKTLDERHEKVRDGATHLAKELADGMTHGPGNLISGLWGLLPLPSFLKK